jgi:Protein of unknown function (DUF3179)
MAGRAAALAVLAVLAVGAVIAVVRVGGGDSGSSAGGALDRDEVEFDLSGWKTDFSKHSVPLSEFRSGGPPRDGIPPIDHPKFVSVPEADRFLAAREPVITLTAGGDARAYPLQILIWHEIVNDTFGGRPIAVTFCPLCNSSLVFDRRVKGHTLRFGTTGNLRRSDLVMWDDRTESWWQQVGGEAIVGDLTGTRLGVLPSQILSFQDFARTDPDGEVLSRDTGFTRDYGTNPYTGYDDVDSPPFALDKDDVDKRLPPKERVSSVTVRDRTVVFRFRDLARRGLIEDEISGVPIVVLFKRGVASALDEAAISKGRDVGASAVFDRRVGRRTLSFAGLGSGRFRDQETGSAWDVTGRAVSGPLRGRQLRPIPHDDQFWFAIAAFVRNVEIFDPGAG